MVTPTNHVISQPDLHCAGILALWGFLQHLPAEYRSVIGQFKAKVWPSERGAPGTVSNGKSDPANCIMLVKRFDEDLR